MLSSDLQKLSVTGLVTLYELDATKLGGAIFRWHGHVNWEDWRKIFVWAGSTESLAGDSESLAGEDYFASTTETEIYRNIIWQGQTYTPIAIQSDGLEVRGDGRPSAPTLVIANKIDDTLGAVTAVCAFYNDFVGATLTVTHVLAKYLDAANFAVGNPTANPSESMTQYWYVEQKTEENEQTVTFELASPLSAQRKKIPTRNITPYCTWAVRGKYRGESCRYMGTSMFTEDGTATDDPALDKCGGRLVDCKLRFGENEPLNFGGFPASQLRGG
ncbi:probable phage minor tail protein [Psychrobacter arcticus 273-4]|uniref:Probable phage minor tail protein n=1 Tax=Psychrobacter arcticus (strain DSM 17307 / VKM B-2377 / 273-4) TaxID=259536 RepID=Q4FUJ9_PSYA2|nr:phage minor tail protein L [Psychrobacter arcticus]AAZ18309.1 probable phage minor tail protein [Psychrobacter arcticus 273-4]